MKNLLLLIILLVSNISFSQSPQKFTYQSVIRDAADNLLQNSSVGIRISIRQTLPSGTIVFQEQHNVQTNNNGLATLEIGTGTVLIGSFNSIDWGNGPYFIETDTDPLGGTNYTINGIAQFLSVPYALYSETAETVLNDQVDDADADPANEIQDISLSNTNLTISSGSTVDLSVIQDGVNDADSDPNNELQAMLFSNDTLYLSDGGAVYLGDYGIDLVDDADNDPNNEIELPTNANTGDMLEFDGNSWVAVAPTGTSGPGSVMYIYDGQTCPAGWNTQQINVAVFGGVPVDACWTDSPCTIMYIYDGQTCPAGWTLQPIGAAVVNGSTTPVDACFKCY